MLCANQVLVMSSRKKLDFLRPLQPALAKRSDLPELKLFLRAKVREGGRELSIGGIVQLFICTGRE